MTPCKYGHPAESKNKWNVCRECNKEFQRQRRETPQVLAKRAEKQAIREATIASRPSPTTSVGGHPLDCDGYSTNPRAIYMRAWYASKPGYLSARNKASYPKNKLSISARSQIWMKSHPEVRAAWSAERRAIVHHALPAWVNRSFLRIIYESCPPGHHVDHIVPLKGKNVCGLHVPHNLQYLPASENIRKHNHLMEEYL